MAAVLIGLFLNQVPVLVSKPGLDAVDATSVGVGARLNSPLDSPATDRQTIRFKRSMGKFSAQSSG
jgi:hypothetical protein